MSRVRHTKGELKTQREILRRFRRFLPTLELKKQQLQIEVRRVRASLEERVTTLEAAMARVAPWVRLLAEDVGLRGRIASRGVALERSNIAGVSVPVLRRVDLARLPCDPRDTPPWIDDALDAVAEVVELRVGIRVLEEARDRLAEELRTTSQRVNLFEKIKIPEAQENIRAIRIFLGDEQAASVARAKLAKGRIGGAR